MERKRSRNIEFSIQEGHIASFDADVIALKYAQAFYGTDKAIADLLGTVGVPLEILCPGIGEHCYIDTQGCISARYAFFVGVPPLRTFNHQHIQEFAEYILATLSKEAPATQHLVTTIHGVGFGLDETEVALAQFAGYLTAMQKDHLPKHLQRISLIDKDQDRVQRLRQIFEIHLSNATYASHSTRLGTYNLDIQQLQDMFKNEQNSIISNSSASKTRKTNVEISLLDVFNHLEDMEMEERHTRLAAVINSLFKEAVYDGYSLNFNRNDGIYLYTPSGVILQIVPVNRKNNAMKIFVYDNHHGLHVEE